ncbi:MAG: hypothetical protein IJC46_08500 [Clostridia bacterium]|nr:hypothetical protein [Clostridia bacterium]
MNGQYQPPQAPQQPYQQPYGAPNYAAPKAPGAGVDGIVDKIAGIAGIFALIFVCIAAFSLLWGLIDSIVYVSDIRGDFMTFTRYISGYLSAAFTFGFYGVITAVAAKLLKK